MEDNIATKEHIEAYTSKMVAVENKREEMRRGFNEEQKMALKLFDKTNPELTLLSLPSLVWNRAVPAADYQQERSIMLSVTNFAIPQGLAAAGFTLCLLKPRMVLTVLRGKPPEKWFQPVSTPPFRQMKWAVDTIIPSFVGYMTFANGTYFRLRSAATDIPLQPGRSVLSDLYCDQAEDFIHRRPRSFWKKVNNGDLQHLIQFVHNCKKRKKVADSEGRVNSEKPLEKRDLRKGGSKTGNELGLAWPMKKKNKNKKNDGKKGKKSSGWWLW